MIDRSDRKAEFEWRAGAGQSRAYPHTYPHAFRPLPKRRKAVTRRNQRTFKFPTLEVILLVCSAVYAAQCLGAIP